MLTIENEFLRVSVETKNAQLSSIFSVKEQKEYLWQGNPEFWRDRAPNLFPFIGRLYQSAYTFKGKKYEMGLHGFLQQSVLEEKQISEKCCTFFLEDNEETRRIYPFCFRYSITYTLEGNQLLIQNRTENLSEYDMYFGVGGHPGFYIPMEDGLKFEDYAIILKEGISPRQVIMSDNVLTTDVRKDYPLTDGRKIKLKRELFLHDALILEHTEGEAAFTADNGKHGVRVCFPDFPYVGFWQRKNVEAPYLCIEPWSALPGREGIVEDLETMPDLTGLAPGKTDIKNWSIEVW